MTRGVKRRVSAIGAVGMVVAVLAATSSVPVTGQAGSRARVATSTTVTSVAQQARVRRYWTPARMRAAKAYPVPTIRVAGGGDPGGISTQTGGRPRAIAGRAPRWYRAIAQQGPSAEVARLGAVDPALYSYPFPFTRYYTDVQLYPGVYPYISVGKIFFTQNGSNFVCSGASVASPAATQAVWTAGHCLSDGTSTFSTNVAFVPSYRNGFRPYGTFPAAFLVTTTQWHNNGDFTRDLGAFRVGRNAAGQTLQSRVGSLGFAWNQPRVQHYNDFGYPAAAPFNGQWMTVCQASHAYDDITIAGAGPDPFAIGCDMTGGSSGGPYIMRFKAGNYINGHNDYKYINPALPLAMFSPYFDRLANQVRCVAAAIAGC
jgi:V8-like Glu-specific endopeptidase